MSVLRRTLVFCTLLAALPGFASPARNGFHFRGNARAHAKAHSQARPHSTTYSEWEVAPFTGDSGYYPGRSGLIQASNGFYYGTAAVGGPAGQGTAFYVPDEGQVVPIYSFCSLSNCADGAGPEGGLIEGSDGNFYGSTVNGGANGNGVIFSLSQDGQETVLYSFCNNSQNSTCLDGANPLGSLVQATDGKLYGTTSWGGAYDQGIVFSIDPAGNPNQFYGYEVIYVFGLGGSTDGAVPFGGLMQAGDGYLYGATIGGGATGFGSIFRMSLTNFSVSTVYSFCQVVDGNNNCDDGAGPQSALVEAADGSLWGTTANGGVNALGTAYRWDGTTLTTEAAFEAADGDNPNGQLLLGSDGNFYGGTTGDGSGGQGSIFQIVPGSSPTVNYLYEFTGQDDGGYVEGSLMQSFGGQFLGMSQAGGDNGYGNVFAMDTQPAGQVSPVLLDLYTAPAWTPSLEAQSTLGQSVDISFSVANAFSASLQRCFATVLGNAATAGNWSGVVSGEISNGVYYGSASFTPTAVGEYIYVLTCGGVESGAAFLLVQDTPSITAAASPSNTVVTGGALTLTASLAGNSNGPTPTGTVTFTSGTLSLGTATVSSGVASISPSIAGLAAGTYTVTLAYSGDSNYYPASTTQPVTVQKANSATALAVSSNAVSEGQPVAVTATVTGADGTTPQGSVKIYTATGLLVGAVPLNSSGVATLTYNTPVSIVGPYTGYATYTGSPVHKPSTSNPESVTISKAPTSVSVSASPNPVTSPDGIMFLVTVSRTAAGATGTAGGYVSLVYNGKALDFVELSGGAAAISISTADVPLGTYSVGAVYYGDKGDEGSTATPISVTVN